jgi:hypothetical protein
MGVCLVEIESIKTFSFEKIQKAWCVSRKIGLKISDNLRDKY